MTETSEPRGVIALQTLAMPADTNDRGDIFGGWLLSQMDLAGGIMAKRRARSRVATVAIDAMKFLAPVFVGDLVACWADIVRTGRTSMTIRIEVWVNRHASGQHLKVTEGTFTYVAIDGDRNPHPVDREEDRTA